MKDLIIHLVILSLALLYVVKEYSDNHQSSSNSYSFDAANYYHEAEDRYSPLAMVKNPRYFIGNS